MCIYVFKRTSKIGDQCADWTAKQILAQVLLWTIIELVGARQMVGPLLSVLAELQMGNVLKLIEYFLLNIYKFFSTELIYFIVRENKTDPLVN